MKVWCIKSKEAGKSWKTLEKETKKYEKKKKIFAEQSPETLKTAYFEYLKYAAMLRQMIL